MDRKVASLILSCQLTSLIGGIRTVVTLPNLRRPEQNTQLPQLISHLLDFLSHYLILLLCSVYLHCQDPHKLTDLFIITNYCFHYRSNNWRSPRNTHIFRLLKMFIVEEKYEFSASFKSGIISRLGQRRQNVGDSGFFSIKILSVPQTEFTLEVYLVPTLLLYVALYYLLARFFLS